MELLISYPIRLPTSSTTDTLVKVLRIPTHETREIYLTLLFRACNDVAGTHFGAMARDNFAIKDCSAVRVGVSGRAAI